MRNKNSTDKLDLNDKIINIIIFLFIILIICVAIISVMVWKKKSNVFFLISGFISIVGVIINIHFYSKEKSKQK